MDVHGSPCRKLCGSPLHLYFKINSFLRSAPLQLHGTHLLTPCHSGLLSLPLTCQAHFCLRTFALAVLLLEELFFQTLACLVPTCPLSPNSDVIFDHWFKVPSTLLVTVYLITLVYFHWSTWHYQKLIQCVYLLTYYLSPPPWNVRDQRPCCIPSIRTVPGILQA